MEGTDAVKHESQRGIPTGAGRPGAGGQTEDLYRLLVEGVQEYAIFALDPGGNVLTWNAGAERLKGYTAQEIVGRHFSTFYGPADVAAGKPERELRDAVREGSVVDEGWRVRKDGSRFWAYVVITALWGEDGALVGFAKVTRDMTQRMAADEHLRRSEERFRLLVQSVRDYGIFMLDRTGHVASWNAGAERIKGYTTAEILGREFTIFYPPEDVAAGKPRMELEVASQVGWYEDEGWRVRKDGTRFWANVVITALRNEQGTLIGFAKVTRDLTERRAAELRARETAGRLAAEEAARQMAEERALELTELLERLSLQKEELEMRRAEAEAANRAKSDFLAAMSHELRTPLNAIGGYAELLAIGVRGPVTREQQEDLERIQRNQQHLLGIINDLLNFTRVEAGRLEYDLGPVPAAEVLDSAAGIVMPQAAAERLAFHVHPAPPGVVLWADRARVDQIVVNLLSNAVKFTGPGGRVDVECHQEGDRVVFRVRDTGIGIPADKLEAVFEPFVQVGRTLGNPREGTGLGLAISRELARAMGGELGVESREGEGSTFTLSLPRSPL
ncbi:MAG TPA: PAS domain-containing sensor histidine kinase [Longimicrobiaceae bacterium]|nr:PAS domain-containing sensor histidine kinase [Longimicrobiaceae bacterium]